MYQWKDNIYCIATAVSPNGSADDFTSPKCNAVFKGEYGPEGCVWPVNKAKGIIKAYKSVIRKIRKINPNAVILVAEVIPSGKLPKYSYIPELNREIVKLVKGYGDEGIRLVDIAGNYSWERLNVADKVHPNSEGREWKC